MRLGLLLILALFVLLFVGGPGVNDLRIVKAIWQSGHFVLFAVVVFSILQIEFVAKQKWLHLFVATGVFSSWFGVATEALQLLIGRDFEFADIGNDIIGGYAGFFISRFVFLSRQKSANNKQWQLAYLSGFIVLALLGTRAAIVTLLDEQQIKSSFPILSNFETAFEVTRWDYRSAKLLISESPKPNKSDSMQVIFQPDRYPDITLKDFVHDWSDYHHLKFSLFSSQQDSIEMVVKVYDDAHRLMGYQYSDRFNQKIILKPGWNHFSFLLETIQNSPKNRLMDLTSMNSFSLFMIDLKKPVTIFLDDLHLSKR